MPDGHPLKMSRRGVLATAMLLPGSVALAQPPSPGMREFPFDGIYLDAAFTHPLGRFGLEAQADYARARLQHPQAIGPRGNPRRGAVKRFAQLINADPQDIAVVPSTMDGENMVNAALGIGAGRGVVTDAFHYDGSLALYAEMARRGVPVGIAKPRGQRIDLTDIRALITSDIRLIAISLISSSTGFEHDLAELCALAHARDVLVYADIIQAAGAMPIDVKASGVDFACCGTYKWLMGDFGTAFLYVRPDRLERLKRAAVGWRQVRHQESHVLPFETPGPALGDITLASDAAGRFEVSTPAWSALAVAIASLDYVTSIGVDHIVQHRQPLIDRLRAGLAATNLLPLTPRESRGPILAYAARDADQRFDCALEAAGITISTYRNRIRISPSVYNNSDDIDRLLAVLAR